ncbi:hypothetical protein [uncultured Bradyrhizobium sp.]|uniref:hypothetical protein n=1 Tax=uncultured Bradyrhizobium sp. TaxID=199684 RepID=UPI0026385825|nr:hypothetical protein [uncultured Bradyrhizobium sp.]
MPDEVKPVERLINARILIHEIPVFGARRGILNAVLANQVVERESTSPVVVASLRFSLATAKQLRDVLEKLLPAVAPHGQAN